MKSQTRELFTKELTKRLRRTRKAIWWRCNKEAVMQLIEDNKNCLARFVVFCKGSFPEHFLAWHVGGIEPKKTALFYKNGNFYRSIEKSQASQDEAPLVGPCSFEETWVSPILKFLEDKTFLRNGSPDKIVAPKGFFVFQFMAQWAAGGYEGDQKQETAVVKATDFVEAAKLLNLEGRANCFWNFSVYFDGVWHKVGVESITGAGIFHTDVGEQALKLTEATL
ncbi:MAG: hypothetical protein Q8Q46_01745 [Candidatus Giovannonibacteria bacterium]|nr:hypothetical protein [Candidatus Giovannonibacteria bacterium]